jgi:peptidoglycan/LPS O-acetylase OafA/YrhL
MRGQFTFGCTLALLLRTPFRERTLALAPRIFALCSICLLAMAISDHGLLYFDSAIQQTIGLSLLGIGCSALIAMAIVPGSRTAWLFDSSALRFFGRYSYGLYVYHFTLYTIFSVPLRQFILRYAHSKAISLFGSALVVCALSVVASMLSYHLYEVRFLKLKRLFDYKHISEPAHGLQTVTSKV